MPPLLRALLDFGHVLGAILAIGGLLHLGFATLPAARVIGADRPAFLDQLRRRARVLTYLGAGLLLVTGLGKWAPWFGGVGWLGGRGIYTAFLHGKLVLALVVFYFGLSLTFPPKNEADAAKRPRRARIAALIGVLVVLSAILHRTRPFG